MPEEGSATLHSRWAIQLGSLFMVSAVLRTCYGMPAAASIEILTCSTWQDILEFWGSRPIRPTRTSLRPYMGTMKLASRRAAAAP